MWVKTPFSCYYFLCKSPSIRIFMPLWHFYLENIAKLTHIYTYLCLLAGLNLLPACRSQLPQGYVRMPVYTGGEHALQVLLPADNQPGLEAASLLQQQHSLLLGRLSPPSHLLLERDSLLLTRIQMQEAVAIEAGFLH
ncbi:MAG: hypothetical protein D6730_22035, partial [Bacteroidetes bacterium]